MRYAFAAIGAGQMGCKEHVSVSEHFYHLLVNRPKEEGIRSSKLLNLLKTTGISFSEHTIPNSVREILQQYLLLKLSF
jgi:hypothetical protein